MGQFPSHSILKHHLRSSLQRQQDEKRCNAQANHNKYLYRRFHKITTKPSGGNTPNPPTHTVINLSDTALSDPQVKLLSRGLKFCPTPKVHNLLSLSLTGHSPLQPQTTTPWILSHRALHRRRDARWQSLWGPQPQPLQRKKCMGTP